ncbi:MULTISPECIES: RecB-family nuclease [Metallosphaera]|uniref:RecB-family nuclease-like protein n=3 Tax=Metallosphaera TaxID=41980 RepID=A4YJ17_METS5|nr:MULTISPECIES: RecB-family nuclease [Metallosphaera]ABP96419.1 RecB-family nuclease-like protein [Metallosphaera sedula DSM 5348]AIM28402.1 RecB-family nuclease-like protein [Metallosphaera sedula]MCH1771776.1 RecB-family nuclease [Metallosphaera sedula]MCP6729944.1 RecB-family nuclease [Metallosphaera sedula]MCY0862591.1 RecB-family nuclease [Metallosphaera prunae]
MEISVVLHNVTSSQRLVDFAKLVFGLDVKRLVLTKVGGTAAQAGIPDVGRLALKTGKSLIILPDLKDAIELLGSRRVYLLSPLADREVDQLDLTQDSLLVFSGIENGFTKIEQSLGEYITLRSMKVDTGPIPYASAVLYCALVGGKR